MAKKTKAEKEAAQRYIVAPGCALVGNKRTYDAGDEISESVFESAEDFKRLIEDKPSVIIKAPADTPDENTPGGDGEGGDDNTSDENTSGGDGEGGDDNTSDENGFDFRGDGAK